MKSISYIFVTALRCCNVRLEKWTRELSYVARLIFVVIAKASVKARESHGIDPKPDDLVMGKAKFLEIRMEA